MIASTYFNILDGNNLKIPVYESYYNEDEIKVFAYTEDFKSFWSYSRNNVFVDSIDPMQTEIFQNIFEKLNSEFSLFDKLNLFNGLSFLLRINRKSISFSFRRRYFTHYS